MKRLKQHWTAGPLACLLSAALTLPVLLAWLLAAPRTAHAQTLNRLPTWAVVTFVNNTGYGGGEVGTEASDGFVVELGKSNKYDVLPRTQTQQGITDLGLVEPLDKIGLQKLARSLEADAVATGEVAAVSLRDNPRRATVTVIIRVVDRVSGELVNGAVAQGTSTPRALGTSDDDSLVNEAIGKADFDAVRQISAFNLPRATVLIHEDPSHVTVNKGSQEGLYPGLNMLVTRSGTEVGRIQVSTVEPDEASATVTDQGLGINTDDIATAIYQLPTISKSGGELSVRTSNHAAPSTTNGTNTARGFFQGPLGGLLSGILGVGIVAAAVSGRGSGGNGGDAIGGGRLGGQSAAVTFLPPNGITPPTDNLVDAGSFIPEAIQVKWNNGNLDGSQIIEKHVFRNPTPISLNNPTYFQTPSLTNAEIGPIPIFSPAFSPVFDSIQDVPPIFVRVPDPINNTNAPLQGNFFTSGVPGLAQAPIQHTGLQFGDRVSYSIVALYTVPNPQVGAPTTTTGTTATGALIYSLSEPVMTNSVTYLQPPLLSEVVNQYPTTINGVATTSTAYPHPSTVSSDPAGDDAFGQSSGSTNINVQFHSVFLNPATGGPSVKYALDFSTDPNFSPNSTLRFTQIAPAQSGSETNPRGLLIGGIVKFGSASTTNAANIDLTSAAAQAKLGANPSLIYVRVGARNTLDTENDYVYSNVDSNHFTDPVSGGVDILPAQLTPGSGQTGSVRAKAVVKAIQAQTKLVPGNLNHLPARPSARPTFNPSAVLHPNIGFTRIVPPSPRPSTAPVRPSTPGH